MSQLPVHTTTTLRRHASLEDVVQSYTKIFEALPRDLEQMRSVPNCELMVSIINREGLLPSRYKESASFTRLQSIIIAVEAFAQHLEQIIGDVQIQACPHWQYILWGGMAGLLRVHHAYNYAVEDGLHLLDTLAIPLLRFKPFKLQMDLPGDDSKQTVLQLLAELVCTVGETVAYIRSKPAPPKKPVRHLVKLEQSEVDRLLQASERIKNFVDVILDQKTSESHDERPDKVKIPYSNVTDDMISNRFYGRETYLPIIKAGLDHKERRRNFYLSLHGMPGVGKTQLALRYIQEYAADYDVVIWTAAASEQKIQESFARAASGLGLAGRDLTLSIEERVQNLLSWLETTVRRWLIVFDNVDELAVLDGFKIASAQGHVLITSRDPDSGVHPVKDGIAIRPYSAEDSRAFFFRNAGTNKPQNVSPALHKLFSEWDGLPMALDQMSSYVRESGLSLAAFSAMYQRRRSKVHSGQPSYASKWGYRNTTATAFAIRALSDEPRRLLHALSFLDPDHVYDEAKLLGTDDERGILLSLFDDQFMYLDAKEELLKLSLIQKSSEGLKVHRLVQAVSFDDMEAADRHRLYDEILRLLSAVYPHGIMGRAMQKDWERCDRYSSHMSYLLQHHGLLPHGPGCTEANELRKLISTCTWFMFETGNFAEADRLLADVQPLIGDDILSASLRFSFAGIRNECNRSEEAKEQMEQVIEIQERLLEPDDLTLGNTYYSAGIVNMECGDIDAAFAFHHKAFEVQRLAALKGHIDKHQIAATYANMSYCYSNLGKLDKAAEWCEKAYQLDFEAFGEMSNRFAGGCFDLGNIRLKQGDHQSARKLHERALEIRRKVTPKHDKFGDSLHKVAMLCLLEDEPDTALALILEAIAVYRNNFDHVPRVARSRFTQARILDKLGKADEASQAREEAKRLRDSIKTFTPKYEETIEAYDELVGSWLR